MTAGLFSIDHAARTAHGVLLPYGIKSKGISASGTRPITFHRGRVAIPRDPMVIGLNDEHERFQVIGRATALEDTDEGILATFALADTDEADTWLEQHGETAFFSAEIDGLTRAPGDLGAGRLAGAAVTTVPAFDGTGVALFSLLGTEHEVGAFSNDKAAATYHDPAATEQNAQAGRPSSQPEPSTMLNGEPDEDTQPDEPDEGDEDEDDDEAPASPTEEPQAPEPKEDAVADAIAPSTMLAGRGRNTAPALTKAGLFAALHTARTTGDRSALMPYAEAAAEVGLFALSNVKYDTAGGLVTDAKIPGTWLGELWQGRRFQRKIIPLLTSGTLTSLSATGWVWGVKPAMAAWAGNKVAVPSNAPTVAPKQFNGVRFAGGHDLAIEYYHFGQTDVINSYADAMIDSYAELSDSYALTQVLAGATEYTPDPGNTVNTGLLDIVDGALAVIAGGGTPSWAIVAPDVYKNIIAIPHEDALEYFNASIGLEGGSSVQGFAIVPDARLTAGGIIVGDRGGATAWELPGVPIRVEAPDLVLGGVDNAFFGYIAVGVTNPNVIVKNDPGTPLVEGVEESVTVAAEKSRK